jgi:hypothetical protein
VPVTARLSYDPADPFAISVSMRTDGSPTVHWVVSRELLAAGLLAPAGDGDIGVWPSTSKGSEVVCVSLSSPDGQALLYGRHGDVAAFLERTFSEVPAGSESDLIDIDGLIEQLLRG